MSQRDARSPLSANSSLNNIPRSRLPSGKQSRAPSGNVMRSEDSAYSHSGSSDYVPTHNGGSSRHASSNGGPSSSSTAATTGGSSSGRSGVSVLARANGPRRSVGLSAAAVGAAAQHDREAREVVKLNVDSTSFEEWMKMATDNKINATNTWGFALIDYFHDMSLLRSDTGDGSINFQKASCTLDGCVKVWTSRVDSVVVETGKLLSGLQDDGADDGSKKKKKGSGNGEDEDEDEDGGDDGEGAGVTGSKKSKRSRAKEATLGKSFSQIAVKKYDLEFSVDPLFKKTSADFDEGGAGGLLMNHLGVDSLARVVFDAGDVAGVGGNAEDDAGDAGDEDDDENQEHMEGESSSDMIDLARPRFKLFEQHDVDELAEDEEPLPALLADLQLCPTFASFRFSAEDTSTFADLMADASRPEETMPGLTRSLSSPMDEDVFGADDFDFGNNFGDANDGDVFSDPLGMEDAYGPSAGMHGYGDPDADYNGEYGPDDLAHGGHNDALGQMFPPTQDAWGPSRPDLTMALRNIKGIGDDDEGEVDGAFFDYFDQRLVKNWAGPEHWKMRKALPVNFSATGKNEGTPAEKSAKKAKEPFVIDFMSDDSAVTSKELFEVAKGGTGTLLPSSKLSEDKELYLLPEDRHFSSRQLLRLFLKPRAVLNIRRRGGRLGQLEEDADHIGDVDEDFWAQAAASRDAGPSMDVDFDDAGAPLPFGSSQFADDDGGFDAMDAGPSGHALDADAEAEDDELATQALKRIRPEYVNYAKKAKKVDIRKLKERIWGELGIAQDLARENSGGDDAGDSDNDDDEDNEEISRSRRDVSVASTVSSSMSTDKRTFQSILDNLRKQYPKDQMEEISTSFCFICLLHLANEEGLEISKQARIVEDDDDDAGGEWEEQGDDGTQDLVGQLELLSIAKDPNAGRSA